MTDNTVAARCPFRCESTFRRKLHAYILHCEHTSPRRLPNVAGFLRWCEISRSEYAAVKEAYPRMADIAELTFIDEAFNIKAANSGAAMNFICGFTDDSDDIAEIRVLCEHDGAADGE